MLLWLLWLPFLLVADEAVEKDDEQYIDIGQWQVSVAVGVGIKTNPLVDGDHIPLIVVPDIAYYGESFYFDNGDLGYTWLDDPLISLSTLLRVNTERAYFSFWHPSNIFLNAASSADSAGGGTLPGQSGFELSIDEVANRRYALDAGVQSLWYFNHGGRLLLEWFNDVSGVYKGHHGQMSYAQGFKAGDVQWMTSIGINYKSAQLVDYYYGISDRDEVFDSYHYQGKQSVSPVFKLDMRYRLNDNWQLLSFVRFELLDDGVKNSPLVKHDYVATGFVGVSYDF